MEVMAISSAMIYMVGCACCIRFFRKCVHHSDEKVIGSIKIALSWVVMYAYLSFFWYGSIHILEISYETLNIWSILYKASQVLSLVMIFIAAVILILHLVFEVVKNILSKRWELGVKKTKFFEICIGEQKKMNNNIEKLLSKWGVISIILMIAGFNFEYIVLLITKTKSPVAFSILSIMIVRVHVQMYINHKIAYGIASK